MTWWRPDLRQTVTYAQLAAGDQWGDVSWGAQATAPARVERTSRTVRSVDDEEVIVSHDVALDAVALAPGDRVWLPGANTGSDEAALVVRDVRSAPDLEQTSAVLYIYGVG